MTASRLEHQPHALLRTVPDRFNVTQGRDPGAELERLLCGRGEELAQGLPFGPAALPSRRRKNRADKSGRYVYLIARALG